MSVMIPRRQRSNLPAARHETESGGLMSLRDEIDRMFEQFWDRPLGVAGTLGARETADLMPTLDVTDRENDIIIHAETPGLPAEEVEISVEDRRLTISGEKKEHEEREEGDVRYAERRFGRFSRTITLPPEADPESVEASAKNGVLTIRVQKRTPANRRLVEVKPE